MTTFKIKTIAFALSVGVLTIGSPVVASPYTKAEAKEMYRTAESLRLGKDGVHNPERAFEILQELASFGNIGAQSKLAYYYLRGVGTPVSMDDALAWYEKAIEAGHDRSRVSYANALIKAGRPDDALAELETAVEMELSGAKTALASNHFDEKFGTASDQNLGRVMLAELAQDGDIRAVQTILFRMSRGHQFPVDTDALLEVALGVAGDLEDRMSGRSAEAALHFLRFKKDREDTTLRTELASHPKIRAKVRIEESLYLARELNPGQFWTESEAVVSDAPNGDFARALVLTARINRNAYVRLLQKELRALGYKPGRATGYLTRPTIRATNKFCRDTGVWDACKYGPLKSVSIKAIAAELAKARS